MTGWLRSPYDAEIRRLALPALATLVAEPLFLLVDAAIVGRLGTRQLAGLGVAGAILTTVAGLCVFLAYGTTAAVARRVGAGDLRGALRQGVDGLWLGVGLGLLLAIVGLPLAGPAVRALGASPAVAPYAETYLSVSVLGLPALLLVLASTGILRGLHDTRTPLVITLAATLLNLVLTLWFVLGLRLGVAGSALGTVLAQYAAAAAYLLVIGRGIRRYGVPLRPSGAGTRAAGRAGIALLLRTLSLRAALLIATSVAARIGDAEVAAYQVSFAVWSLLALALDAIAIAGQPIIGRLLGAGDPVAARGAARRMLQWGIAAGVVLGLVVVALSGVLPRLFTNSPEVQSLISSALIVVGLTEPVAGAVFALDGVLIGAGDHAYLARAGLVSLAAFLPVVAGVLAASGGLVALWWALGVWLAARLAALAWRVRGSAWAVPGAIRP